MHEHCNKLMDVRTVPSLPWAPSSSPCNPAPSRSRRRMAARLCIVCRRVSAFDGTVWAGLKAKQPLPAARPPSAFPSFAKANRTKAVSTTSWNPGRRSPAMICFGESSWRSCRVAPVHASTIHQHGLARKAGLRDGCHEPVPSEQPPTVPPAAMHDDDSSLIRLTHLQAPRPAAPPRPSWR